MSEKRRTPRRRWRCIVTIDDRPWFTTDVGPGGFGVAASVVPPQGTRVTGLIRGKNVVVPFSGVVTWALRGNMHISQRSRAGVRFVKVGPTIASLLDELGLAAGELRPPDSATRTA
jgi:hypothetical protein